MSWAVGRIDGRHIGYGVPAKCDHPDCDKTIDRGIYYRCGDMGDEGCDLFFCTEHLVHFVDVGDEGGVWVCERCAADEPAFDPKPDTVEWAEHVLTDESWEQFRAEEPAWTERYRQIVEAAR